METAVTRLAAGARKIPRFLWGDNRRLTMLRIRIAVSEKARTINCCSRPASTTEKMEKEIPAVRIPQRSAVSIAQI